MGRENDPQKVKKRPNVIKILFWAQTKGPRGSVMKCKSDGREISGGILVFKVSVRVWLFCRVAHVVKTFITASVDVLPLDRNTC